jgi:hypothetical protein
MMLLWRRVLLWWWRMVELEVAALLLELTAAKSAAI